MITDHLPAPRAILFDLDGTLADTAPDLAAAINLLRARAGLAPTPYEVLRPTASAGARGMIGASYGIAPGESGYEALKDGFLNNYEAALAVESRLFDGIPAMLEGLQALGLAWGVVTNKAARFTDPLVGQIGLGAAGCVISGDTMPHPKPHPAPPAGSGPPPGSGAGRLLVRGRRPARHPGRPCRRHADGRLRLGLLRRRRTAALEGGPFARYAIGLAGAGDWRGEGGAGAAVGGLMAYF